MKIIKWRKLLFSIKQWIFIGLIGIICFLAGTVALFQDFSQLQINMSYTAVILLAIGGALIVFAANNAIKSIVKIMCLYNNLKVLDSESVNQIIHRQKVLSKGPNIVVIGGGTGLSVLLRGLKEQTSNITAIVTVADDGGGSGVLREELGMLPPGDIRNCILALADTEPTMEKVLRYRFTEGSLKGQSFGNLFIAAMNDIYGDFNTAIKEMSNVLAVKGRVLPMTAENVKLFAELHDGTVIEGESQIPEKNKELGGRIKKVFLEPLNPVPLEESLEEIRKADCIVFGPGSLFTSVMPNLLVKDIVGEIEKADAVKIYIGNIMTQPGETDDYTVTDHMIALLNHTTKNIIDYVIANVEKLPEDVLEKYRKDGSRQILITKEEEELIRHMGIVLVKDNLAEVGSGQSVRHDSKTLSELIYKISWDHKLKKSKKH